MQPHCLWRCADTERSVTSGFHTNASAEGLSAAKAVATMAAIKKTTNSIDCPGFAAYPPRMS
jgi:hypothetical protein